MLCEHLHLPVGHLHLPVHASESNEYKGKLQSDPTQIPSFEYVTPRFPLHNRVHPAHILLHLSLSHSHFLPPFSPSHHSLFLSRSHLFLPRIILFIFTFSVPFIISEFSLCFIVSSHSFTPHCSLLIPSHFSLRLQTPFLGCVPLLFLQ